MKKEYVVYKGETLLATGTKEECAAIMGVQPDYIYWLTMPTAKRRLASRKNPERCTTADVLTDED